MIAVIPGKPKYWLHNGHIGVHKRHGARVDILAKAVVLAHGDIDVAVKMRELNAPKLLGRMLHILDMLTHEREFHFLALELAFHLVCPAMNAPLDRR